MGHKILLADDSITIQKVIELTFSDEDFELHTVGNGQKAIDEITAIQPDIVLCDIIMPEKNGYEVCEFIKSTDGLKHIPVLLLTGAFEPFDQERAKAAGCEGFLAKPFEPQTLISKVKELLEGAQAPAPAALGAAPQRPVPVRPDPLMQGESAFEDEADETVLVAPPSMGGAPPPFGGPQVPAIPTPVPFGESSGLDQNFAIEAGERELAMDPGDHTMLLGANDSPDVPSPPSSLPGASDDIWSDVSASMPAPPAPGLDDDEGATVYMSEPPPIVAPFDAPFSEAVDNEMSVGGEDLDQTWQMPGGADVPPPPSPEDELGGFEDFAAPPAPPPIERVVAKPPKMVEPPALDNRPPSFQQEPIAASMEPPAVRDPLRPVKPIEVVDPFTPEPPELGATNEVAPIDLTPELIPSVDTQATIDPVRAGGKAFEPLRASSEPASPEPLELTEIPVMSTEPETDFTPVDAASDFFTPEPLVMSEPPAMEMEAPAQRSAPATPAPPAPVAQAPPTMDVGTQVPMASPERHAGSSASPGSTGSAGVDDDLVERVAQRVVDKLSSKVIQEIAWEVVPDLAEGLIRREIDFLKSKLPKSG